MLPQSPLSATRWLPVTNEAATPVPPYGVMGVTGFDADTGAYTVTRPTADSMTEVLINGPVTIPAGAEGQAHRTDPCTALVESGDGTPARGDDYGTEAGSWKLHKDKLGFRCLGAGADGNTGEFIFASGGGSGAAVPGNCDLAALKSTDCLQAVGPSNTVYLKYDAENVKWYSTDDLIYPGASSPGPLIFWFENGQLHLKLDGTELLNCGGGCWKGGPLTGHVSNSGGSCAGTTFTVCLTCSCCPIAGWDGAGWYCVNPGSGTCAAVYLTDDDKCDTDIDICSGPYADESAATAACTGGGGPESAPDCCGGTGIPANLTALVLSATGTCAGMAGLTFTMTYVSGTTWRGNGTSGGLTLKLDMSCSGTWQLDPSPGYTCNFANTSTLGGACDKFVQYFTLTFLEADLTCCVGTATVKIYDP